MAILLWLGGVAVFVVCFFTNQRIKLDILTLAEPERLLAPLTLDSESAFYQSYQQTNLWAQNHQFYEDQQFDFDNLQSRELLHCGCWVNRESNTYLVMAYYQGDTRYYLFSLYGNALLLMTSNHPGTFAYPRPKGFAGNIMRNSSLEKLFQTHCQQQKTIRTEKNLAPCLPNMSTSKLICRLIRKQVNHLMAQPFWQLRGSYWHYVRRPVSNIFAKV